MKYKNFRAITVNSTGEITDAETDAQIVDVDQSAAIVEFALELNIKHNDAQIPDAQKITTGEKIRVELSTIVTPFFKYVTFILIAYERKKFRFPWKFHIYSRDREIVSFFGFFLRKFSKNYR